MDHRHPVGESLQQKSLTGDWSQWLLHILSVMLRKAQVLQKNNNCHAKSAETRKFINFNVYSCSSIRLILGCSVALHKYQAVIGICAKYVKHESYQSQIIATMSFWSMQTS